MPFNWTPEAERTMLLIACSELKPKPEVWAIVAERLGGGLNGNAVSQKFYKLKKESEKLVMGTGSSSGSMTNTPATKTVARGSSSTNKSSKKRGGSYTAEDTPTTKRSKKNQSQLSHIALAAMNDVGNIDVKDEENEGDENGEDGFKLSLKPLQTLHDEKQEGSDEDVA